MEEMAEICSRFGSDVPFCLLGGTMLATGTGTTLKKLRALPKCHIVVCKPDISVSTAEAYSACDSRPPKGFVYTDELNSYSRLSKENFTHGVVHHNDNEFVVGDVFTNTIEGFWSHFKKMVFGTYHSVSKKYLQRYIDEEVYRWNTRKMSESYRFNDMFAKAIRLCSYDDVKNVA
jgi:4-diphosphocytidyl-2C-methyl-D-erythritol kinase